MRTQNAAVKPCSSFVSMLVPPGSLPLASSSVMSASPDAAAHMSQLPPHFLCGLGWTSVSSLCRYVTTCRTHAHILLNSLVTNVRTCACSALLLHTSHEPPFRSDGRARLWRTRVSFSRRKHQGSGAHVYHLAGGSTKTKSHVLFRANADPEGTGVTHVACIRSSGR